MINSLKKMAFHTLLLVAGAVNAMADNVVSIEGYDILPGQEKTLSVVMTNTDKVSFMQFDLVLPEGLVPDGDKWYVANTERMNGLALYMTEYASQPNRFQVLILSQKATPIAGKEGSIIDLNVKATDDFNTKGMVQIVNIKGATAVAGSRDVLTVGDTGLRTGEFGNLQVQPLVQSDAENIKVEAGKKYDLVILDEGSETAANVAAKINELNAKIDAQELVRSEAMEQLAAYIEYLEKMEGDVNLDGRFNSRDVQKMFDDVNSQEPGFDFNGDNRFNSRDVQALFNKLNNI